MGAVGASPPLGADIFASPWGGYLAVSTLALNVKKDGAVTAGRRSGAAVSETADGALRRKGKVLLPHHCRNDSNSLGRQKSSLEVHGVCDGSFKNFERGLTHLLLKSELPGLALRSIALLYNPACGVMVCNVM